MGKENDLLEQLGKALQERVLKDEEEFYMERCR